MKIFRATSQHIEPITFLFDQYRQHNKQDANLVACRAYLQKRMAKEEAIIFGAQNEQRQIIGFILLVVSSSSVLMQETVFVQDLFVHPTARRQGVGKLLMSAAQAHAKEVKAARLTVQASFDNHAARQLYTQLGYSRDLDFFTFNLDL